MTEKLETVVFPEVIYKYLQEKALFLGILEATGVSSWEGYESAREEFQSQINNTSSKAEAFQSWLTNKLNVI